MAITWYQVIENLFWFGVDWNATSTDTKITLTPTIYRKDTYATENPGGRYDITLSPDPLEVNSWSNLSYNDGARIQGETLLKTLDSRTYDKKANATITVTLSISWSANTGSYNGSAFQNAGTGSHSWTYSVPALPTYTITYKPGAGTGTEKIRNKEYNKTYTILSPDDLGFNAPSGKIFDYWADSNNNQYNPEDTYSTNANLTLTAIWDTSGTSVTLNGNERNFAHAGNPMTVTHAYADNSGTKWAIRGTPLIENAVDLEMFQGYYLTRTFENAEKIYELYQLNGEYLKNTEDNNYATIVLPGKLCFSETATGDFENTIWKPTGAETVPAYLYNIPTWSKSLSEPITLYALWAAKKVTVKYHYRDTSNNLVEIGEEVFLPEDGETVLTNFTIGNDSEIHSIADMHAPFGYRLVRWQLEDRISEYLPGSQFYLGPYRVAEPTYNFVAVYEKIVTTVRLDANGGYFGNDPTKTIAEKICEGDTAKYNYRGQPNHPKNLIFLGYFDEDGHQVYWPYDNAYYNSYTTKGAKAMGDGLYFSETPVPANSLETIANENDGVQFHDTTMTKNLETHYWIYWKGESIITLYAHWKSATNAYIMDNNEWKSASIYVNTASAGESPNWQPIDSTVFFDN